MARKKPTSTAIKSYFEDFDESDVFVSVVDETPADDVVEVGVTGGTTLAEAGPPPGEAPTDTGEFEGGLAEDGPAEFGELGDGFSDAEFPGTPGEEDDAGG